MRHFSDGVDRPDSCDANSLWQAIERYFADANEREVKRLRRENALMRRQIAAQEPKTRAAAGTG